MLIVGAGIGGLALARALHERGTTADVVERMPEWETSSAGLYLPGNSVRALDELGIWAELAACANLIVRQRVLDHRGRRLADIDVHEYWDGVGACVAIRRAALHEALHAGSVEVPLRLGLSVTDLEDDGHEKRGASPTARQARTTSSSVRTVSIDHPCPRSRRSLRALRGTGKLAIRRGGLPRRSAIGRPCWAEAAPFSPSRSAEAASTAMPDVDSSEAVDARGAGWRELFVDFADPVPRLLQHAGDAYRADRGGRAADLHGPPRCAVGDAAHASSPNMAQGAAMALEDALVLSDALATSPDIEEALTEYRRRRTARVAWVQEQTHRRDRTRNLPPIVRNLTLRLVGKRIYHSNYRPLRDPP